MTRNFIRLFLIVLFFFGINFLKAEMVSAQAMTPTLSISASPSTIEYGGTTTISWTSTGYSSGSCIATINSAGNIGDFNFLKGIKPVSGSETHKFDSGLAGSKKFEIQCNDGYTKLTKSVYVTVKEPIPALTYSFTNGGCVYTDFRTGNHTSVMYNGCVNLYWYPSNASSCWASGDWSGDKNASGPNYETKHSLTSNKTYSLECWNSDGASSGKKTLTVNVPPKPNPYLSFFASPNPVNYNNATWLKWTTADYVDSCWASGDWEGWKKNTGGSEFTEKITSSKTYYLECWNSENISTGKKTLTINPIPKVTLSANPTTIAKGRSSNLTWTASSDATYCWGSGGDWEGWKLNTGGTESVSPSATTTYSIKCGNSAGIERVASVTVLVAIPPAPTLTFSASPSLIYVNSSSNLNWVPQNVSSCWASGDWGGWKSNTGGRVSTGSLTEDKIYYLECWNSDSVSTGKKKVAVSVTTSPPPPPPPVGNFSFLANPARIKSGENSNLIWTTNFSATSCWGSGGDWEDWKSNIGGTEIVYPPLTTDYIIECWNSAGVSLGVKTAKIDVFHSPTTPVINGPILLKENEEGQFDFYSSDLDGSKIRYEIDWNNDDIFDRKVPLVGFVAADAPQKVLHSWSSPGLHTLKIRTIDDDGNYSGWGSHFVSVSSTPDITTNQVGDVFSGRGWREVSP